MPKSLSVMAFDFGMTRIGVAIGDMFLKIPHPLATITGKNKFEKFAQIRELVDKWQPQKFVVGIPQSKVDSSLHGNATSGTTLNGINCTSNLSQAMQDKIQLVTNIKRFSNRLKENFKIDVEYVNEEYSSAIASAKLNEQKVFALKQKDKLDALAATVILQRYFDEMKINVI